MPLQIETPVTKDMIRRLQIGDQLEITGTIYTGRDAALPLLVESINDNPLELIDVVLEGGIIFHTAVSGAGIGPTTSNKVEIEESIPLLSKKGIRIHIGKGSISQDTINALEKFHSIFAVTPPISALLTKTIVSKKVVAFREEGIEAIYKLKVKGFPAIVAVSQGKSIYD